MRTTTTTFRLQTSQQTASLSYLNCICGNLADHLEKLLVVVMFHFQSEDHPYSATIALHLGIHRQVLVEV